jgi:hypothetical protein
VIPKGIDLDRILCIKTERTLRNDFTVAHDKKLYQVLDNVRTKKVLIEERIDGSLVLRHKDSELKYKQIMTRPEKEEQPQKTHEFKLRKIYAPPANHPWRKSYPHSSQYQQKEEVGQEEKELLLTLT